MTIKAELMLFIDKKSHVENDRSQTTYNGIFNF